MAVEILLLVAGGIMLVAGLAGSVIPAVPGPPLAWAGLLVSSFSSRSHLPPLTLLICAAVAAVVVLVDTVAPVWFTSRFGGTKSGLWGSTAGLVVGLFFGIPGILIGPFLGALVGELIHDREDANRALKSACAAFGGFIVGTGLKLITVIVFIRFFVASLL